MLYETDVIMLTNPQFDTLIEALEITNPGADKVIKALQNIKKIPHSKPDISTINSWIKPEGKEGGFDNLKVGRCLVWYIAKIGLENKDILPAKFPFEDNNKSTQLEYRYHKDRYIKYTE